MKERGDYESIRVNYSTFLEIQEREKAAADAAKADAAKAKSSAKEEKPTKPKSDIPRKLSYKERKELERLEQEIERDERAKEEIEEQLALADYKIAQELADRLKELTEKLDRDMERWSELAELT